MEIIPGYQKEVIINGQSILLRPITPLDKGRLAASFTKLSPQAIYQRFFEYKKELTPAELIYFTELDGINHLAICAITVKSDEIIAVARMIRQSTSATEAEVTLVVLDHFQHCGLGNELAQILIIAARERQIKYLSGTVRRDNQAMLQWLDKITASPLEEITNLAPVDIDAPFVLEFIAALA